MLHMKQILYILVLALVSGIFLAPVMAYTTQITVTRMSADGITPTDAVATRTYQQMEAGLPVMGDGNTWYYYQGRSLRVNGRQTMVSPTRSTALTGEVPPGMGGLRRAVGPHLERGTLCPERGGQLADQEPREAQRNECKGSYRSCRGGTGRADRPGNRRGQCIPGSSRRSDQQSGSPAWPVRDHLVVGGRR